MAKYHVKVVHKCTYYYTGEVVVEACNKAAAREKALEDLDEVVWEDSGSPDEEFATEVIARA